MSSRIKQDSIFVACFEDPWQNMPPVRVHTAKDYKRICNEPDDVVHELLLEPIRKKSDRKCGICGTTESVTRLYFWVTQLPPLTGSVSDPTFGCVYSRERATCAKHKKETEKAGTKDRQTFMERMTPPPGIPVPLGEYKLVMESQAMGTPNV